MVETVVVVEVIVVPVIQEVEIVVVEMVVVVVVEVSCFFPFTNFLLSFIDQNTGSRDFEEGFRKFINKVQTTDERPIWAYPNAAAGAGSGGAGAAAGGAGGHFDAGVYRYVSRFSHALANLFCSNGIPRLELLPCWKILQMCFGFIAIHRVTFKDRLQGQICTNGTRPDSLLLSC